MVISLPRFLLQSRGAFFRGRLRGLNQSTAGVAVESRVLASLYMLFALVRGSTMEIYAIELISVAVAIATVASSLWLMGWMSKNDRLKV